MAERCTPSVVIVGGGIVGCSIAYHLAKRGVSEVTLFERRQLTCGTTWHAAGLLGQLRATPNLTQLAQYTTALYARLEAETGQATGYVQTGSVTIATNEERLEEIHRQASMARGFGLVAEEVDREWIARTWPAAHTTDLLGGIHLPEDGSTNPVDTTRALAAGARQHGARIVEDTKVLAILETGGRVRGVRLGSGEVPADIVVLATGMWTHGLARQVGVNVPLHGAEHFYIVTEPVPGLAEVLPTLREPDACSYYKRDAGGRLLIGFFEPRAKPWGGTQIPEDFCFDELPEDWDHIEPQLAAAMHRIPGLASVGIRKFFNGPEAFTPDGRYYLGEAPELAGCFVAAGFNSIGIQSAGGAGKVLTDWILDGEPPMDLWDVDLRRALPFQGHPAFLRERTTETLGLLYAMHWPQRQFETGRGIHLSPLHDRIAAAGACFGEVAGWERPNWYAALDEGDLPHESRRDGLAGAGNSLGGRSPQAARRATTPCYEYSWGRPNWFANCADECRAVRERVGIFDQSSFAKFEVLGADAESFLGRICAADIAVPPGRIVYTQWLNEAAGIEADLTVTRIAAGHFRVVGGVATSVRDRHWLELHRRADERVEIRDSTKSFAVLGIMGPASRALLGRLGDGDFSGAAFPFGTSWEVVLAGVALRASRITYVGELGWELYIPRESVLPVYDALLREGATVGLAHAGYHAMEALRIEKAYRHWGHDITTDDTPVEAGLSFAVAADKKEFIGRAAFLRRKEEGPQRRLVSLRLRDPDGLLHHDEPVWRGGKRVGHITSGAWSHTFGRAIGLGYILWPHGQVAAELPDTDFEIEIAGRHHAAEASLSPFYDPTSQRPRDDSG